MLLETIMSLGFAKLIRTLHMPGGVEADIVNDTVEVDETLHERAATEHAEAEHGVLNRRKLSPNTVMMLPGKELAGKMPPKLWCVDALATIVVPFMMWTNKFFTDSLKLIYMLQLPTGITEFITRTTSVNDATVHATD